MARVFVSSVSRGLEKVRQQVIQDLRRARYEVEAMEEFGAQASAPIDVCLREVRRADVVVLVVGPRYGSVLPQGISYTQAEFREARSAGIPVLAFSVPSDEDATDDEREHLDKFLAEVGGASVTYDAIPVGVSLERLSARILAALAVADRRGELTGRYSIFQQHERYFARSTGHTGSLFSHEGPFEGREAEVERLVAFASTAKEAVLLLTAPGGCGKSRLLLEAAKLLSDEQGTRKVLFVDPSSPWSSQDIAGLPVIPSILVFDDAHRRPDLDRLIAACLQHNGDTVCIISCRPSALGTVRPLVSQIATGVDLPTLELKALSRADAESLARHLLGPNFAGLAARLVDIADRNPLVISVGARCVALKRVAPEVLERTPEAFRRLVLDRLLDDPGLAVEESGVRLRLLEIVSAIGPVSTEDETVVATVADALGMPAFGVRRLLPQMEHAGLLLRRGRLVRVNPDVLADHLLYRASVDENGVPTGFVDAIVERFGTTHLENILGNCAELDWRSTATTGHASVLTKTWEGIRGRLAALDNSQRRMLLEQLRRPALYAPEPVLCVAEWIHDHPEAPVDEALSELGLEDTVDRVLEPLTELLAIVGRHPDYTQRCVAKLLKLAEVDERPTGPHPGHPRRRLAELLSYSWRAGLSHEGAQTRAAEAIGQRLRVDRQVEIPWAVEALGAVLARVGDATTSTLRAVTIRQFSLAPFYEDIRERRESVIDLLRGIALGPRLAEAAAALRQLGELLRIPHGPLGRDLGTTDEAVWLQEAERGLALLVEIASEAEQEVIRFLAMRELREARGITWDCLLSDLDEGLSRCPRNPSQGLFDLLIGTPQAERLRDYHAEEARVDRACREAAGEFWAAHGSARDVVAAFLGAIEALEGLRSHRALNSGKLVWSLVHARPAMGLGVVQALVDAGDIGRRFLRPALVGLYEVDAPKAEDLTRELSESASDSLRAHAADALQFMVGDSPRFELLQDVVERLSQDPSVNVRRVVPEVLRTIGRTRGKSAVRVLTSIEWGDDSELAGAVLDVLHPTYGIDPSLLEDGDIDLLLSRMELLRSLDDGDHSILRFLEIASVRRPSQTVTTLLHRVAAVVHDHEKGDRRWTPIPYSGHGLSLPGVIGAQDHELLIEQVRNEILGADVLVKFWIPTLFAVVAGDRDAGMSSLTEWVSSRDEEKVVGAAILMKAFGHDVVFSAHELVAELLEAAARISPGCLRACSSELFSAAIGGTYSGTPGEPAPRHLSDRASAQELTGEYGDRPTVRDFYASLVGYSERSIAHDLQRWEEEGDDG